MGHQYGGWIDGFGLELRGQVSDFVGGNVHQSTIGVNGNSFSPKGAVGLQDRELLLRSDMVE